MKEHHDGAEGRSRQSGVLRTLDLNLLHVFEAIMRHRSVSAAGRELDVSASAISHALGRLRRALADELFVPGDRGMEPTPRALALAPDFAGGLARLEAALTPAIFDPTTSPRCFRMAASDYSSVVILPGLVRRIAHEAPCVSLRVFPANRIDVVSGLEEGRLDTVVGWFGDAPDRIKRRTLFAETETLVARGGHALAGKTVTAADVLGFPQLVVDLTGGDPQPDQGFVSERGVRRRTWIDRVVIGQGEAAVAAVSVTVPHYAAVAPMLCATDMVCTLPRRLAAIGIGLGQLAEIRIKGHGFSVDVEALWHGRLNHDPGLMWLIAALQAAATLQSAGDGDATHQPDNL